MSILTRKLLRTIRTSGGQFVALVVIVLLGVMIYIGMNTALSNLSRSQEQFYQDYRFADYTFMVVKAPESVVSRVEAVPGVIKATGRIQKDIPIVKKDNDRATGRLTGYPLPMEGEVNRLHLLSGNWFDEGYSTDLGVLVDPQFFQANALSPGDRIEVIAEGKKVPLTVIGTATSPEFVFPMPDAGTMISEPGRFGIIMIPQTQAQQILNYTGQINQIVVDLAPGADETVIVRQIEQILEPYGNLSSFPRDDQLSHAALQAELDGLKSMSSSLPLIFFLIAATIQFVILNRLIKTQRLPIGVMKALGYNNRQIIWNYAGYALIVSGTGAILGVIMGIAMASGLSQVYAQFFNLPTTIGGVNLSVVLRSVVISLVVGLAAGLFATRGITRINPAEAMRPEPPVLGRHNMLENWTWLWQRLDSSWKMGLRSIFRNRVRFAVTVLGVVFTVCLLIFALFMNDAVDYLLKQSFTLNSRYDYMVRFTKPVKYTEMTDWSRWDEVQKMEPILEVPVKIKAGDRSEEELLTGLKVNGTLRHIYDMHGQQHQVPEQGILLSQRIADKLGLKPGDMVEVQTTLGIGPSRTGYLPIVGTNDPMTGSGSFVSWDTANRLLGENQVVSGVMLKLESPEMSEVESRLYAMNGVSSVMSPQREQAGFVQYLDTMIVFIVIMVLMAGLLGLAIVYNTSMMTFQERRRELASLRVIGYSQREVASLLRKETGAQAILGIIIGLPAGKVMGAAIMASVSTDLFSLPAIIYPRTYIMAALLAVIFVWMGQQLAIRKTEQIDMVEALKNRD
ncbi:MAG: ABC transporter permease [Syntrophomonadaceae bacterium]|jgi:putative ABC transport system permease protein|nr:FtsX-like permease family protein [Bacillota bacterium]NLM87222.1 ABC transporter permease [Syntrophomonadaceae bacterium]HAA09559.1 hypothetical protein [Syntrophomonas sp.]